MTRILFLSIFAAFISACSGGASGGGGNKSAFNADSGEPGPTGVGGTEIACTFREPRTLVYYSGYGDSNSSAAEIGVEVCQNLAPAGADCNVTPQCETRKDRDSWTCTIINTLTGDRWTANGRSRLETFSYMHGICSAGIHGSPQVCTSLEQSACVEN